MNRDDFFNEDELKAFFGCSQRTIYRWIAEQGFPRATRVLGKRFWKKTRISEWVRQREAAVNRKCPAGQHQPTAA